MSARPRILVITPVRHIAGVAEMLEKAGDVVYLDDPTEQEVINSLSGVSAIYTNPNKSNVYLGERVLGKAMDLKVICTASTGTTHIDKLYAAGRGFKIISLTEEREVINKISSTAELAFGLTLAALRHIPSGFDHVKAGGWDYTQFIGRQMNFLTVGIVGYGRLGGFYAGYAQAFGSRVLVYDPYKTVTEVGLEQVERDQVLRESDVIAFHVHVTPETTKMINQDWFSLMKPNVLLVNTARGEIFEESDLLAFLRDHPEAFLAADVVANEVEGKADSPLIEYAQAGGNILLTPHIGGMTREGQQIAYGHAGQLLMKHLISEKVH